MTKTPFARLIQIVGDALERPEEEREAYVVAACAGDQELLNEARRLLADADATSLASVTKGLDAAVRDAAEGMLGSAGGQPGRIGPYEIVRPLGRGGMGVVWLGRQEEPLRRNVAVKIVRRSVVDANLLARFHAERRALALMQHPNIATVYDAGTTVDDQPYLVMELVDGRPITEYVEERGLGLAERLELFGPVCRAMHHAHERGVVHRDLKPSNILIQEMDGRPTPKVIDFGIAKAMDGVLAEEWADTVVGGPIGTLAYMSPEQVRGGRTPVDRRADVYALGVVLYEILTGRHPFGHTELETAGLVEAQRIILETDPPRPSAVTSAGRGHRTATTTAGGERTPHTRVGRELDWIVLKALAKEPDRRYTTTLELAEDLERYARDEPVVAGPPGLRYRARKLVRRHRSGVAAAVSVLASLALASGIVANRRTPAPPAPGSVAVLPFTHLSGDTGQAYFTDGLTEEILNALAQTPGLRVAARSSSFQIRGGQVDVREAGRSLGVAAVVEGSVRVEGESLRVTAQLVDAASGYQLWSGQYDRWMSDVFSVQEEIARAVASALSVELLPDTLVSATTRNVEAYRLYLRGRHQWRQRTEAGMWAALESFERAIALDPDYAAAYAGLADTWTLLPDYGGVAPREGQERGKAAALRALELDGTLAEAHVSLAALLDDYDRDRNGAEAAYRRAIELNPGYATARHWLANHLADEGRFEEALEQIEHARRLDPLSNIVNTAVAAIHYFARDWDRSIAEYGSVLESQPRFALGWALLGRVQLVSGRVAPAIVSLERALELSPDDPGYLAVYAAALAEAGRTQEARSLAERVRAGQPGGYIPYCELASAYIRLGEHDDALELLRIGVEQRDPAATHIAAEPLYDAVRDRPEFEELLRLMGLAG